LKKGRPLLVEGRLRQETWEDKQTKQKRSKIGVVLESFSFLDSGNGGGEQQQRRESAPPTAGVPTGAEKPEDEDSVPF
jgi:single-strand DNA-binding protein